MPRLGFRVQPHLFLERQFKKLLSSLKHVVLQRLFETMVNELEESC